MARVTFTQDFNFKPTPRKWLTWKAGETQTVKRAVADAAIAAGKAKEVKVPRRKAAE